MAITQAELIKETLHIFEFPLRKLGYKYSKKYFEHWDFGFYKKASKFDLYLHIEFQPLGFNLNNIFDLAINLIRDKPRDMHISPPSKNINEVIERFNNRLSPRLYQPGGREVDHWWHFVTIEETRSELNDIYDKLIKYGIPYLEDPNSHDIQLIRD